MSSDGPSGPTPGCRTSRGSAARLDPDRKFSNGFTNGLLSAAA